MEPKDTPERLTDEQMNEVAGGAGRNNCIHDLSEFTSRIVCGVTGPDGTARLTLHSTPNGRIIPGVDWKNGDEILVHRQYRMDGWYFAYKNGVFGYVDPNYVR